MGTGAFLSVVSELAYLLSQAASLQQDVVCGSVPSLGLSSRVRSLEATTARLRSLTDSFVDGSSSLSASAAEAEAIPLFADDELPF